MADIKHVFVLMLENRSFDHLFTFSGRSGVPSPDASWGMTIFRRSRRESSG
jgi:phospholipase C